MVYSDILNSNLSNIVLQNTTIKHSDFTNSKFEGAEITKIDFRTSVLNGVDFSKSKLVFTRLSLDKLKENKQRYFILDNEKQPSKS